MRMKHLVGSSFVALALLQSGVPAYGQEYFLRERLKGLPVTVNMDPAPTPAPSPTPTPTPTPEPTPEPNYTYTPTYSSTYGACSSGFQSAPMTKCTRSDDKSVALSYCSSFEPALKKACPAYTCGGWTNLRYATGNTVTLGTIATNPAFSDRTVALRACEDYAENYNVAGACIMETGNVFTVQFVTNPAYSTKTGWRGAICTKD